jgi:hypothetical protein
MRCCNHVVEYKAGDTTASASKDTSKHVVDNAPLFTLHPPNRYAIHTNTMLMISQNFRAVDDFNLHSTVFTIA